MKHAVTLVLSLLLLLTTPVNGANRELQLPSLGDASSGISSPYQEQQLGREVLRLYRSQVPTSSDYQLIQYTENLLQQLAPHSDIGDLELNLILIEDGNINAFAAPGGIIGVNTGLITSAETEDQVASVLAHELAHLSQRHYARQRQQQQQMSVPYYAALLGSLIIAATSGSDAGLAAMMSTQAAALDAQLRFSRQFEQEADRLGMRTLAQAGFDPRASGDMFEIMLRQTRYTERPPEFLLTHPVTERRIADTRNRTLDLPDRDYEPRLDYHLMRARARVKHADSPAKMAQRFQDELDAGRSPEAASRYGLALAQLRAGRFEEAESALAPLLEADPEHLTYQLLAAELDTEREQYDRALERLKALHDEQPEHYAVTMDYALALMKAGRHEQSTQLLKRFSRQRPADPAVWYWLAEVSGLAGDILQVHEARAEYFIQVGAYRQAMQQLRNALKRAEDGHAHTRLILRERLKQVEEMQRTAEKILG